ncbi:MAG: metallophosphoesterase family protein [Candidatus Omnitrophota bacterium]
MRIGVISDTHIPLKAEHVPAAALDAFKQVDMVVHAGDMIELSAINELREVCQNVVAVCGNMDPEKIAKKFPVKNIFQVCGFKIAVMHGYGAPVDLIKVLKDAFKNDHPNIIIFGHSHQPMNEIIDGVLFFNPGSATDQSTGCTSYGILDIDKEIDAKIIKI